MSHAEFTITLDTELRDEFVAAAQASDRLAPEVVRDMMRDFVRRQHEVGGYDAFVRAKVEKARASKADGHGVSNEDVEAEFAVRRQRIGLGVIS